MRKIPETISNAGLLVGWSLEPSRRKSVVGFSSTDIKSPALFLEPIIDTGEGHLLTVAPTGAGKGTGCIIPALLRYDGPVVVVDPKGENYAVTARRRREMGQEVILLDPFGITGEKERHRFNPLDLANPSSESFIEDVASLSSLIAAQQTYKNGDNLFWTQMGSSMITAAIIDVLTMNDSRDATLTAVRDFINLPFDDLLERAKKWISSNSEELRKLASLLNNPADTTVGGYLAFAINQLDFLKGEQMKRHLCSSDLDLNKIYDGSPLSIYLVVPPDKLESHSALLRLWIGTIISVITRRTQQPEKPTLMLLDEAAQLGTLPQLRQAITLLRGYGVRVWSFWQDLSQLKNLYPFDWETILNNSRIQQFFGATTGMSAEVVSRVSGYGNVSDVMDLDADELILNVTGDEAVIAAKPSYLQDPPFKGFFDPNPFYKNISAEEERIVNARPVYRKSEAPSVRHNRLDEHQHMVLAKGIFHPVTPKEWHKADAETRELLFNLIGITNSSFMKDPAVLVSYCKHSFHSGYTWLSIEDARETPSRLSYYLMSSDSVMHLDGKSEPIHEANKKCLDLNSSNIKSYLEFFCTNVHGGEGRFLTIENSDEIQWRETPDETYCADLKKKIKPIRIIEQTQEGIWILDAEVLYGTDLFTARFSINPNGTVDMIDDTPIATDLPVITEDTRLKYIGFFDKDGQFWSMRPDQKERKAWDEIFGEEESEEVVNEEDKSQSQKGENDNVETFIGLDTDTFIETVKSLLKKLDYSIDEQLSSYTEADGIDFLTINKHTGAETLVWVRRWKEMQLGEIPLRNFAQTINETKADRGLFITTVGLTEGAKRSLEKLSKVTLMLPDELNCKLDGLM